VTVDASEEELRKEKARGLLATEGDEALLDDLAIANDAKDLATAQAQAEKIKQKLFVRRAAGGAVVSLAVAIIVAAFRLGWMSGFFAALAIIGVVWTLAKSWMFFFEPSTSARKMIPYLLADSVVVAAGLIVE
jgi:hypothetical protein